MTPEEKLSIRAVTVFKHLFEDNWKHETQNPTTVTFQNPPISEKIFCCSKCKEVWKRDRKILIPSCTVPDPLPLTWDNAMRVVRTCVNFKVMDALFCGPYNDDAMDEVGFDEWLLIYAEPKHLIEAACNAAEQK